ncbi:MAG: Gfo/Idh/MocA family oxidoreductase [Rhodothermaceae bacterium]|nr:Gfo/Idh/MocA family oxidoreductase [Rhodothermaceae bacterium]
MAIHKVGIIMNGVTGRMGTNQHLMRSIVEIIKQGGVPINAQEVIMPDPVLVGRNPVKLEKLALRSGVDKWTTNVDEVLQDPAYSIYFDAQTTDRRVEAVKKAIDAGKHIYCEKPTALTAREAYELYEYAEKAKVKHGVVQDKLWLPGLVKLQMLRDSGFFGKILSVRGEFGYWVFEGDVVDPQRPSWNYRAEDGGGILTDMLCHWRYVLDNLFGAVESVSCIAATHIPERWDEQGNAYACTADDAAYATMELEGGIIAHFNSSWCVRPRRDDLLTVQVDGTKGSAVAGLQKCWVQSYGAAPRYIWNPDIPNPEEFYNAWNAVPDHGAYPNAFKAQWELFLRYVVADEPYRFDLREGAKGVQLAECATESWKSRSWVSIPPVDEAWK